MTHSSRRYYFRQITNENYKEKRVQYGALRYARWNSTPCTIYSFYDNSLLSFKAHRRYQNYTFWQQDIICHSVKSLCKVQENNVHLFALIQGL